MEPSFVKGTRAAYKDTRKRWGPVDEYPGRHHFRSCSIPSTRSRLLDMPDESQHRVANALSAFSFRPYLTRLWVRTGPRLHV
jgi:hypothetical protein